MRTPSERKGLLTRAAIVLALAAVATPASADLASLKAKCQQRDASGGNGTLPYIFCDDGVPPVGGRVPNIGAMAAVAVPQKYKGFKGLPANDTPDATAGADPNGDIALDVDVSLPDPTAYPPSNGLYPLIVMMHGCCAGDKTGWEANTIDTTGERWHYNNAWFAARGYVVLTYTARGFVSPLGQGSTGETQIDSRNYEINDFQYLAGLLADDSFFNVDPGRVVVTGGSYGGGFSWLALTDPDWVSPGGKTMRLAAAAPKYGWSDLVYSLIPTGAHLFSRPGDELPPFDGSASLEPFGVPKRSINAALYASGTSGTPTGFSHATFAADIHLISACIDSGDPYELNPACVDRSRTLGVFLNDRSAYYQNDFFDGLAKGKIDPVPVFSAGTLTDTLFPSFEHRRMVERLKAAYALASPNPYPVQEYYGDYQHFTQNKAKEWGDVCGTIPTDHHVCTLADYSNGLNADPPTLVSTIGIGVTTRLNRFIDFYAKPPGDSNQEQPKFDVTASLQVCPVNATGPADEPGERFTALTFGALAPNHLSIAAPGAQATTSTAAPNPHAATSEPVANSVAKGGSCVIEQAPGGMALAGPGVATYDSESLSSVFTMIGQTRVTVTHLGIGRGIQLNTRLYDLYPDGTQVMVDRGIRRLASADDVALLTPTTTVLDLDGNGWRFPAGHKIRIELAQDDDPYARRSNQPSAVTLQGVTLDIPVRETSANLSGGPAPPGP